MSIMLFRCDLLALELWVETNFDGPGLAIPAFELCS